MKKRKPVEDTPLPGDELPTITKWNVGGVKIESPGFGSRTIALEDLHPLVMEPENYDSEILTEVVIEILGELERRKYVNQVFENDLASYGFGVDTKRRGELIDQLGHILAELDTIDPDLDLNDYEQFRHATEWLAKQVKP